MKKVGGEDRGNERSGGRKMPFSTGGLVKATSIPQGGRS